MAYRFSKNGKMMRCFDFVPIAQHQAEANKIRKGLTSGDENARMGLDNLIGGFYK
jgi:hypothetical protein